MVQPRCPHMHAGRLHQISGLGTTKRTVAEGGGSPAHDRPVPDPGGRATAQVASWGGYSFIINLLPIHCLACVVTGRLTPKLYVAYAPFVVLGTLTAGAPGWSPPRTGLADGFFGLHGQAGLQCEEHAYVDHSSNFFRLSAMWPPPKRSSLCGFPVPSLLAWHAGRGPAAAGGGPSACGRGVPSAPRAGVYFTKSSILSRFADAVQAKELCRHTQLDRHAAGGRCCITGGRRLARACARARAQPASRWWASMRC